MFLNRNNQTHSPVAENTISLGRVGASAGSACPGQGEPRYSGTLRGLSGPENLLKACQT